jgi:hypothetical protein
VVRALIIGLGLLALVASIASAIHAAALSIAIGVVIILGLGFLWLIDYPAEKKKPPE